MKVSHFCELLFYKTQANLRAEISRLYLNYVWWVLEPLFSLGVLYVVFGIFMNNQTPHFILFLLIGLSQWQWFASTVLHAAGSLREAAGIMMQVDIPKVFFPLEVFLQDTFKHFFVLLLMSVFIMLYPVEVALSWITIPLVLTLQGLFIIAVSILFASLVPFVPDLRHIFATGVQVMFFVSGIFFNPETVVLPKHIPFMYLNPMAGFLHEYRHIIINGQWPDWIYLGKILAATLLILAFALIFIHRCDRLYPKLCQ